MRSQEQAPQTGTDWAAVARGASTGFTILIIGGVAQPLVGRLLPPLGVVWLTVIAVLAFVVAGMRAGEARLAAAHGAGAALCAYLLSVPLVLMVNHKIDVIQLGLTAATAILVGAVAAYVTARVRG